MRRTRAAGLAMLAAAAATTPGTDGASFAQAPIGVVLLSADLSGDDTWPVPGDLDGSGEAQFRLDGADLQLCYEITVEDIGPATAAVLHAGGEDVSGPPLLELEAPIDGSARGCLRADPDLLQAIAAEPARYYLNVYNAEFPLGALRGQLGD